MKITNQPPKGTSDWLPEEFRIRKYIFDTWRRVCVSFGYQEYLTPIVESADIYRAKSGEDVGGKELMTMFDRANRELAIRPEMTPSVTRMVSKIYEVSPKPLRLFSIANFLRNEKPQRGRNREFWQLNFDVFGSESENADIEIIQLAIEIMNQFGATREMYKVYVNNKGILAEIITNYLKISEDKVPLAVRVLDKYGKLKDEEIKISLLELGAKPDDWNVLFGLLSEDEEATNSIVKDFLSPESSKFVEQFVAKLKKLCDADIVWKPSLARGFDYYDGMVFEVFDKNPENSRSLFGGGRYNGLAEIFGAKSFPAVGCAPGDETTKLFLESWGLLDKVANTAQDVYYIPLLDDSLFADVTNLATKLREEGLNVKVGLTPEKVGKALEYANKLKISFVVLLGEDEIKKGKYVIKNMKTGEQQEV